MDNDQIAAILTEIGAVLEIRGENPFKVRAFQNAARAIEALDRDIASVVHSGGIGKVRGIGASIGKIVTDLVTHGRSEDHEAAMGSVPAGVLELMRIQGLGPKRTRAIWKELGVESIADLESACTENRLAGIAGFGPKTQDKVRQGIAFLRRTSGQFLLCDALAGGEAVVAALPGVVRAEVAGSVRRSKPVVGDVDVVAAVAAPLRAAAMEAFVGLPDVAEVLARGDTKSSVRLGSGLQVDLRLVAEAEFPYALAHFTGSKAHNVALRARAQTMGMKLNEYGLWKGKRRIACKDEAEIHEALGLASIPPELREDQGEVELAAAGPLPPLVGPGDIRGALHVHTQWSDGSAGLSEMVEAASDRGWAYVGISDHSQAAGYARGLSPDRVREQHREIDAVQEEFPGIRILKGIEADILPDGRLDYDESVWRSFDYMIGSVHSAFGQSRDVMTRRVLKAMENPRMTILGHPTGRILLARDGYALDMEAVLAAAARRGVAIEINANPQRLDLDPAYGPAARQAGVRVSIEPDAHSIAGLDDIRYGVAAARRAGFGPGHLLDIMGARRQ